MKFRQQIPADDRGEFNDAIDFVNSAYTQPVITSTVVSIQNRVTLYEIIIESPHPTIKEENLLFAFASFFGQYVERKSNNQK